MIEEEDFKRVEKFLDDLKKDKTDQSIYFVRLTKRQVKMLVELVMLEFYESQAFGPKLVNIDWCEVESQRQLSDIFNALESAISQDGTNHDGLVYVS